MAVADAVDSDDGGKALIQEMIPFEAEAVIANLVKSWIRTRVDRLKEWVERNLQQEIWNPRANKERVAPSGVEALRVIDETLEAFFLLPIPMHPALLPELLNGLDRCLQNYIFNIKSGCGSQSAFIPKIPSLTRCATGKKIGVFKKKERTNMVVRKNPHSGTLDSNDAFGLPQLCVRVNTLHHIRKQLEVLEKRSIAQLRDSGCVHNDNVSIGLGKSFELSASACIEGIKQLSETIAYKVVFHDLSHVFWDFLYVGNVSSSRTEPFLQELEKNLEIISSTVHDRVRTRVITDVMKASFEGLSMILLAGGPFRAFTIPDAAIIDEDFKFLMDLFWSDGDGLPSDLIDKYSVNLKGILQLLHTDTQTLITQFQCVIEDNYGASGKSMPLPPTSGRWSPSEPNTILPVLCYRNDKVATKFIKKHYNLPKKL
nr:protein unc-13 homolog [Ipomoea batatas]